MNRPPPVPAPGPTDVHRPGRHPDRCGFSLIELLMVLGIVAVLASLTLMGARALGIGSKRARTETILSTVRDAIDLTIANKAIMPSPAEHPLAGSRPGRARFTGWRGRTAGADGEAIDSGTRSEPARDGEALRGVAEWQLASDRARLLMDEDRFADPDLPFLFGAPRGSLHVLGASMECVTRYRRIPHPRPPARTMPGPYDASTYDDALHLVAPTGGPADSARSFGFLFGSSNVESELAALGALFTPPDDTADHRSLPPLALAGLNRDGRPFDNAGRVWTGDPAKPPGIRPRWEPGRVRDGLIADGADRGRPAWKRYRLRGLAIYDAWDVEILFSVTPSGAVRLISAGADGVLRWHPGPDGVLDTAADADAPAGDDRDGARDNVRNGLD